MLVYDHEKALKRPFNYTSVSPFQIFTSLHSSFLTALKMAAGGGLGSGGGNPFWSLVWLLALIFCGWPLAGFCAGWYILILPFAVCFDGFTVSWFLQNIKRSLLFLEFCEYNNIWVKMFKISGILWDAVERSPKPSILCRAHDEGNLSRWCFQIKMIF